MRSGKSEKSEEIRRQTVYLVEPTEPEALIDTLQEFLQIRIGVTDPTATAQRWVQAILEFAGCQEKPPKTFDLDSAVYEHIGDLVVVKNIPFTSICDHHLFPIIGRVSIAYVPTNKVLGLSKFARIVREESCKPMLQEEYTKRLADRLLNETGGAGVMVIVRAMHTCMVARGVRAIGSEMVTSAVRGVFAHNPVLREEALRLIA